MEVSESQLVELYNQKDTDELLDLYRSAELTDLATKLLVSVLYSRGVRLEDEKTDFGKLKKSQKETPETAQKTIKSSTTWLYVISALQILASLGFQFYLGIAFGVLLAILAFTIRTSKSSGASLAVAILGGIAAITNFIGPIVTSTVFGNLILSLITLWLGVRSLKACKILAGLPMSHNKAINDVLNTEILKTCEKAIRKDLGALDDIPHKLANTIANIYYQYFDIARPLDVTNGLGNFAKLESDIDSIPEFIDGLRKINKDEKPELYEYAVTYLLDCLKYDIKDVNDKTEQERMIERKLKGNKVKEIPNLVNHLNV